MHHVHDYSGVIQQLLLYLLLLDYYQIICKCKLVYYSYCDILHPNIVVVLLKLHINITQSWRSFSGPLL